MEQPANLWIFGDPIVDVFITGYRDSKKRFIRTESPRYYNGGALNTYKNACFISNQPTSVRTAWRDSVKYQSLVRLGSEIEFWDYSDGLPYSPDFFYAETNMMEDYAKIRHRKNIGLIFSDYNKGSVNTHGFYSAALAARPTDFCIVDSRYRSLNLNLIENCKIKIWHATGDEFDLDWSKNFDYVIRTNGPGVVDCGTVGKDDWQLYAPPKINVIDPIGAGDTFTAAVGVYFWNCLRHSQPLDIYTLRNATEFAIKCAQSTVTQKHTAISTITLRDLKT